MSQARRQPETLAAQALHYRDAATGGVVPPIQPSSTYARDRSYAPTDGARTYGRDQNPTPETAEALIATLEGGEEALLFASGMAAATALFRTLKPGDRVAAPRVMYHGLRAWLAGFCAHWGLGLDAYDNADPDSLKAALKPGKTRIVWVETPSNPTWDITGIAAAAQAAHGAGAILAVDSTVATPVLTRPLALGADIVFHSATKYLNGHSDVVAGALVTARREALWQAVRAERGSGGAILGAFDAWLLLRGMRTLFPRIRVQCDNAMALARHFEGHWALEAVLYPGLESHPGHDIATRQMSGGFGGMLSIRVRGGAQAAIRTATATELFLPATSLGGVESLVEHRATVEGADSPVPPDLLRLSVGIEAAGDLIADLEQALTKAVS